MTKMVKDGGEERDLRFADVEVEMNAEDAAAVGGGDGVVPNPNGFDPMDLLDVNDASIFYDDFPPLPDFPCMSSSSSTSSTPPASKVASRPIGGASSSSSSTSSPAASWAMMEEDSARMSFQQMNDEVNVNPNAAVDLSSTASMDIPPPSEFADCVDVMENFELIDLIDDCNELWDPSSVFQTENPQEFEAAAPPQGNEMICGEEEEENDDGFSFLKGNSDLAMIFFEWLKQNKDYISAEDMRSIKLKRSTIESASKRLGSSKEGKKQLLKLILEWVEQYQLQKKARLREGGAVAAAAAQSPYAFDETPLQIPNPNPNPNFIYNSDPNTNFQTPQWMPPPPPPHVSEVAPPPDFPPPMHGYTTNPYNPTQIPMNHGVVNGIPYQHSSEYPLMDHAPAWAIPPFPVAPPPPFSPFPDNANILNRQQSLYGNPYQMFDPNGERMMRLGSSATKEARKKRMARQRRLYSHHRHSSNSNQNQNQLNDLNQIGDGVEDCDHGGSPGNSMYWSKGGGAAANLPSAEASQPNPGDRTTAQPRQAPSDRRQQQQGWKTEKNLKFLLQKVLKQSDVGNLGRIVLPKKEAESHLPELESRDGISIAMEDIGTSRIWNMRYRFWPNNKSRMYLLENTGDFVRVNGLQEGDFIVIYSDTKCGKYMIRGVKVRQPGGKSEGKKPARRNIRNLSSLAGNNSPLAPIRQAVR